MGVLGILLRTRLRGEGKTLPAHMMRPAILLRTRPPGGRQTPTYSDHHPLPLIILLRRAFRGKAKPRAFANRIQANSTSDAPPGGRQNPVERACRRRYNLHSTSRASGGKAKRSQARPPIARDSITRLRGEGKTAVSGQSRCTIILLHAPPGGRQTPSADAR